MSILKSTSFGLHNSTISVNHLMCSLVETNIALGFGEKEELLIIDSLGFPNSPNTCLNDA